MIYYSYLCDMKIFLDDKRFLHEARFPSSINKEGWTIVRTYNEFVRIIDNNFDEIEIVAFDHDIACWDSNGNEQTGRTAQLYLEKYCLDNDKKFPNWIVHTDNTNGRDNIIGGILSYLRSVEDMDITNFRYYHRGMIDGVFV